MIERVEDASELRWNLVIEGRRQRGAECPPVDAAKGKGDPVPGLRRTIAMGGRYPLVSDDDAGLGVFLRERAGR